MVAPHKKDNSGQAPVQTKTMFITEGNPAAVIVENRLGKRAKSVMEFPSSEAAFRWCREHGVNLVYMATNISNQ